MGYQPSRRRFDNQFKLSRLAFLAWIAVLTLTSSNASNQTAGTPPGRSPGVEAKHIIMLIGDGMGFEHVRAAGMYLHGSEGTLSFESFPHQGEVTTYCSDNPRTDSAAAATAIATGNKVNRSVVSVALPGDGAELKTIIEYLSERGYRTGLVTTTANTDATPAAFAAHEVSRNNLQEIADDYYFQSRPNVIFGGGATGMSEEESVAAGYEVVTDALGLQALDPNVVSMANGLFGAGIMPYEFDGDYSTLPHLSEMASVALDILDQNPDGFFVMIEGGLIDKAGHANNLERMIFEMVEFNTMVEVVIEWAAGRDDTLVIVTADHETGGLDITQNNGEGNFPDVTWSTTDHTDVNIPIYAFGPGAERINGVIDNTEIFGFMQFGSGVPQFTSDLVSALWATLSEPYAGSITGHAIDITDDPMTYSLLSGPPWLELAPDGTLGGTPGPNDLGPNSWTVQVDDGTDGTDVATLELTVCGTGPTTWYPDLDSDGHGDPNGLLSSCEPPAGYVTNGTDCNDSDEQSWGTPVEVDGLALIDLADGVELTWASQAFAAGVGTVYDIATGRLSALRGSGSFNGASCLASDLANPSYVDTRDASGPEFYYLLRARNSCGAATFGDSTALPDPRDDLDDSGVCP